MAKTTFLFVMSLVSALVALVLLARAGDTWAMVILAVLWTALMIGAGALIVLLVNRQRDQKAQADFAENARENLAMMQALQRVQNEQNKTIMHQLGQAARLPGPAPDRPSPWVIEPGIFDDLDI